MASKQNNNRELTIGFALLAIIALVVFLMSRNKKGTITTIEKYRAKVDTAAYFVMRSDQFEYGWNPDFSKYAKNFKTGDVIGDAVGYFPTVNSKGNQFTFMVFEVPFVYGTTVFLCIDKANLSLI
jgi:hypothetical protein